MASLPFFVRTLTKSIRFLVHSCVLEYILAYVPFGCLTYTIACTFRNTSVNHSGKTLHCGGSKYASSVSMTEKNVVHSCMEYTVGSIPTWWILPFVPLNMWTGRLELSVQGFLLVIFYCLCFGTTFFSSFTPPIIHKRMAHEKLLFFPFIWE